MMKARSISTAGAVLLAGCAAVLMAGCATYIQGRPAVYDLPGIQRVAVWSFGNEEFTDAVTEVLVHCSRWQIHDRRSMERIMQEQDMEQTDRFDKDTAVRLGKLAGVNMIVFGEYEGGRAVMKAVDVETGKYYVYKNVYVDAARPTDFKAWYACQYLVPYAIRIEDGVPAFVWCGGNVDTIRPRDLP